MSREPSITLPASVFREILRGVIADVAQRYAQAGADAVRPLYRQQGADEALRILRERAREGASEPKETPHGR